MKTCSLALAALAFVSSTAFAHDGHHEASFFASLSHLMTEPYHWGGLAILLCVLGFAVASYRTRNRRKQDRSSTTH